MGKGPKRNEFGKQKGWNAVLYNSEAEHRDRMQIQKQKLGQNQKKTCDFRLSRDGIKKKIQFQKLQQNQRRCYDELCGSPCV